MARPSESLLRWLRKLLQERKLTAATLAEDAKLPRGRVRQILTGAEAMTVDELLAISQALKLSASDFGFGGDIELSAQAEEDFEMAIEEDGKIPFSLDPLGNQPSQLFQIAFAMGIDFLFLMRADEIENSGVPKSVIDRYRGRELPVKLDAAYHQYNQPRYDDFGIKLTLSFDSLYECSFPWTTIRQVIFFPATPPAPIDDDEPEEEELPPAKPFLRLVK